MHNTPRFLIDSNGDIIATTWDEHPRWRTDGKWIGLAPANYSPLAHDNQSQQLAMPANPAMWLDPV